MAAFYGIPRSLYMGHSGWISRLAFCLVALGYCTENFATHEPPRGVATSPWLDTPSCPELLAQVELLNPSPPGVPPNTNARLYFLKSPHPEAALRPVMVLIPGGPGLSYRTLAPLTELNAQVDLVFMDPPAVGEAKGLAFEHDLGNQYDRIIENVASTIHNEIEVKMDRDVSLVGFSSGGVIAGEAIARFSPHLLRRVKGLVVIAACMTDSSYRALCQIRENSRLGSAEYQTTKSKVQNFPQPYVTPHIRSVAQTLWHTVPTESEIKQVEMAMDRDNFVQWILQHGDLIWNEDEEAEVAWLLLNDSAYCSPESVRKLIKNWRQDRKQGDATATRLKELQIPILSIIGGNDRLIPAQYLREDAVKMGATPLVVDGASHFVFVSDLEKVTEAIYRFHFIPSP